MEWQKKCWGQVIHLFGQHVSVSLLQTQAGFCCSRHHHTHRWNSFRVIDGLLAIVEYRYNADGSLTERMRRLLNPGQSYDIPPGIIHRFEVLRSGNVVEIYWTTDGTLVEENDIIRFDEGGKL